MTAVLKRRDTERDTQGEYHVMMETEPEGLKAKEHQGLLEKHQNLERRFSSTGIMGSMALLTP